MNDRVLAQMLEDILIAQTTMRETLHQMISRGDRLDVLVHKSSDLEAFTSQAVRSMPRSNERNYLVISILIGFVVLSLIVYLILL